MSAHSASRPRQKREWWKEAIIYQIYPASFKDGGSGDRRGWGDLAGITSKVDYLRDLGVDILWISPIYPSPQADMGYDISNYMDIDPLYGTVANVDHLITELKKRNMKLMMDLVVNHTSNQHAWFRESASSKVNPKRDWYIWKPAKIIDGRRHPPNNWSQLLGEKNSVWTYDATTDEYYLSLFTPEQPDLNWENPDVRSAVHDVLRFWLDRGVCGFRMDVINLISKHQDFPDAEVVLPDHSYQPGDKYFANGPRLHEFLSEINREVLSKYGTITVGEMPFVQDDEEILRIVRPEENKLNMIFIFELVELDSVPGSFRFNLRDWNASDFGRIVSRWQKTMIEGGGWNSVFIENHDQPRSISHFCDDSPQYREISGKTLALMQTTLSGTLFIYQGEEIGMTNFPLSWDMSEYKDIESNNFWAKTKQMHPNNAAKHESAKVALQKKARDNARTPFQWSGTESHAGFCRAEDQPWMRVNDNWRDVNAESQLAQIQKGEPSVLGYWRKALQERKVHADAFVYGSFETWGNATEGVFAYLRVGDESAWGVVLNLSPQKVNWEIPSSPPNVLRWVQTTYEDGIVEKMVTKGTLTLRPWEGVLGMVELHP